MTKIRAAWKRYKYRFVPWLAVNFRNRWVLHEAQSLHYTTCKIKNGTTVARTECCRTQGRPICTPQGPRWGLNVSPIFLKPAAWLGSLSTPKNKILSWTWGPGWKKQCHQLFLDVSKEIYPFLDYIAYQSQAPTFFLDKNLKKPTHQHPGTSNQSSHLWTDHCRECHPQESLEGHWGWMCYPATEPHCHNQQDFTINPWKTEDSSGPLALGPGSFVCIFDHWCLWLHVYTFKQDLFRMVSCSWDSGLNLKDANWTLPRARPTSFYNVSELNPSHYMYGTQMYSEESCRQNLNYSFMIYNLNPIHEPNAYIHLSIILG